MSGLLPSLDLTSSDQDYTFGADVTRRRGMTKYTDRLQSAANRLIRVQAHDGGWGITPTSVSSIVNTVEALTVLRAAQASQDLPILDALDYVSSALPEHLRTRRKGGRGENTRFATFGLEGLITFPTHMRNARVSQALSWTVDWLHTASFDEGWAEARGVHEASLHQTALATINLARLTALLHYADDELQDRHGGITQMVEHGVTALLRFRRHDGSWPVRTYANTASSPSKTALAAVALAYASDVLPERHYSWGQAERESLKDEAISLVEARDVAVHWLEDAVQQWATYIEPDVDVPGTAWMHLAYAQCLRGVGTSPYFSPQLVRRRLRYLQSRWNEEHSLWTEPPGGLPTIRCAYHTVWAHETFARQSQLHFPDGRANPTIDGTTHNATPDLLSLLTSAPLSTRESRLISLLSEGPRTTAALASTFNLAQNSIPKIVARLNDKCNAHLAKQSNRSASELIISQRDRDVTGTVFYVWRVSPNWLRESG